MKKIAILASLVALGVSNASAAFPIAERLDRGVVAVKTAGGTFVSWRSLTSDNPAMTFDVYRDGVKVNSTPITKGTNLNDTGGTPSSRYIVKASVGGSVVETSPEVGVEADVYRRLHLDLPTGSGCTYTPNDMSVGDVDGDGRYELFVKWNPSNSHDNSENGTTGNVFIDCYTLDGKKLWRIDLGRNIRAGAHYTQFMVFDFDGDGKAEMICKTAPGTIDGRGQYVIMGEDNPTASYVNSKGHIISGPEYLTVFDGQTGAEMNTIAYNPPRSIHPQTSGYPGWGDSYGGRSERYLAGVAYLDGVTPTAVFCRGYYTHSYLWAVDYKDGKLTERWLHASTERGNGAYGEGAHSLTVGDCDGDGFDEIVYGAAAIDHDGTLLYRTGAGHGDALHLGDFDPDREGLEVFMVHEETSSAYKYDAEFRDARTGKIIWSIAQSGNDIGRGMAADISPAWRGHEIWPGTYFGDGEKGNATFDCKGNLQSYKRGSTCFRIYWDGDLLDELFDGGYDSKTGKSSPAIVKRTADLNGNAATWSFVGYNAQSCNTTKATPCLQADILGDWREELILWDHANPSDIMIFTSTILTNYRVPCLMEDHNYRLAVAWQNTAYNQPPHLSYNLAESFNTTPVITVGQGYTDQTIEIGTPIDDIVGSWKRADKIDTGTIPPGLLLEVDNVKKTFRLSGTPTKIGKNRVRITARGERETVNLAITITVVEPAPTERVAYFPMDDISSTTPNIHGGEAAIAGSPEAVAGKVGNAVRLNGTSDYIVQPAYDAIQMGSDGFTAEMLVRSTDDAAYILHKGSISVNEAEGASGHWFGVEYKNGNLKFGVDDNVTKTDLTFAGAGCFDGDWHHLVLVRDTATKTLKGYIDGILVGETADKTGAIADNRENLVIGDVNNNFNNKLAGDLDEVSLYRGAMSAATVKSRYNTYKDSGVVGIGTDRPSPVRLTLYNAVTGIEIARGIGEVTNVTAGVAPGVYILVTEQNGSRHITKLRL